MLLYKTQLKNILISRHLLQLHHDDGGEQRGVDGGGAQLPPQDRGDPRDAHVGGWIDSKLGHISWFISYHHLSHLFFLGEVGVSAMDALAVEDEPPGKENHKEKDKYDK